MLSVGCGLSLLSVCLQDVCKIVVNYCHTLKERVRVLSENSDHGSAINMVRALRGGKTFYWKYFKCYITHISKIFLLLHTCSCAWW